jgi:hypothetical protein
MIQKYWTIRVLDREQSNREMYGIEYRFIGGFN